MTEWHDDAIVLSNAEVDCRLISGDLVVAFIKSKHTCMSIKSTFDYLSETAGLFLCHEHIGFPLLSIEHCSCIFSASIFFERIVLPACFIYLCLCVFCHQFKIGEEVLQASWVLLKIALFLDEEPREEEDLEGRGESTDGEDEVRFHAFARHY